MKKSVVYIVVDALCFKSLRRKVGKMDVMPFLNRLSEQSLSFNNMYTQAPYTEASLVSILTGENTLDSGGYLFGNGTTEKSVFEDYRQAGYKTIFSYSPYVYSKGYLKGVTDYYYTRLYSLEPLFLYRLDYYRNKWIKKIFSDKELEVCRILLEEAIETWKKQCNHFIENSKEVKLIQDWISNLEKVRDIYQELLKEECAFKEDYKKYIEELFLNWDNSPLRTLNKRYVKRSEFLWKASFNETMYTDEFSKYQARYSSIIKKRIIDVNYVLGMLYRNKNGYTDTRNTLSAYKKHYLNHDLQNYMNQINENSKVEVSMRRAFDVYYDDLCTLDKNNENYFAYIHMQEFHLPSVFHTLDTADTHVVHEDFMEAFKLLDNIDASYRGNIIADLSANYCDRQIERFYKMLKENLKNEFLFVVTADHGFPSYEEPPRPIVYNQTYTEAFHVPYIVNGSSDVIIQNGLFSNIDAIEVLKKEAGISDTDSINERKYILCEYGGPGCPDISSKEIWYTYIDKKCRVSVQCKLSDEISMEKVVAVYDIEKDPKQLKDLYYKRSGIGIEQILAIIQNRHQILRNKFEGEKFIKSQIEEVH